MELSSISSTRRILIFIAAYCVLCTHMNAQLLSASDSLQQSLEQATSSEEKLDLLIALSKSYTMSDASKGLTYAHQAIALAGEMVDQNMLPSAYNSAGGNLAYLSEFDSASFYFQLAYDLYLKLGDAKGIADMAGNLGMMAGMKGRQAEALDFQFKAIEAFEAVPDSVGMGNTYQQIADIYYSSEKYDLALKYGQTALEIFESIDDHYGVAMTEGTIANIYGQLGNREEAEKFHKRTIDGFSSLNSPYDLARELSNYATLKEEIGDVREAVTLTYQSLDLYESLESDRGVALAKGNLGSFYLTAAQKSIDNDVQGILPDESLSSMLNRASLFLQDALEYSERSEDLVFIQWLSESLAKVYELNNNHEDALQLYKRSNVISDSLSNLESQRVIEELTTEREVLLKDKQIELDRLAVLKKRNERVYFIIGMSLLGMFLAMLYFNYRNKVKSNRQLKLLNGEISTVNKKLETKNYSLNSALNELQETQDQLIFTEREKQKAEIRTRISQDIHDDISSGLTKIAWLAESFKSNMAAGQTHKLMPLVQKINISSKDAVSKLGEIIWSTSPSKDNVDSFLRYLRDHIDSFLSDSRIKYTIDFPVEPDQTPISPAVRRNLYLVLKEALHNSFKYSEATELDVRFSRFLNKYELTISDNGKGFSPGDLQGTGNGLDNMRSRMEAIDGVLSIETSPRRGVKIKCLGSLEATI